MVCTPQTPNRVVVADDDVAFAEMLAAEIEAHPRFEVVGVASDGEQAVQLSVWQNADVVFMDVCMPKLDGIEATRLLLKSRSRACVLLVSGAEESAGRAADAGASAWLPKADLVERIDDVLAALAVGVPGLAG